MPRRRWAVSALVCLAATTACAGDGPTGDTAAPTVVNPGNGGSAPIGVSSLDGIKLQLRRVAEVNDPVALSSRPGTTALYIAEKAGRIRRLTVDRDVTDKGEVVRANYSLTPEPVLDITAATDSQGERGLLGLAFSQDGGELYAYSTDRQGTITLDAYRMNGERADTGSRRPLLRVTHPRPNHNGGQVVRGPDGFLYVGIGDGGGGGDPDANGQNPTTLLGKILRIDPTRPADGKGYGIPAGNPFSASSTPPGAPEVWAYGLRNPWRFGFDRQTGDLWIGDVGQNEWEEIDFLPAAPDGAGRGANLGWNRLEGSHSFRGGTEPAGYVAPIYDYPLDNGACSVIGGYVYRGVTHPEWQGMYVWSDYCLGRIHLLLRRPDGRVEDRDTGLTTPKGDLQSGGSITSFGEDADGELYALSASGGIYRLEPA